MRADLPTELSLCRPDVVRSTRSAGQSFSLESDNSVRTSCLKTRFSESRSPEEEKDTHAGSQASGKQLHATEMTSRLLLPARNFVMRCYLAKGTPLIPESGSCDSCLLQPLTRSPCKRFSSNIVRVLSESPPAHGRALYSLCVK